jgi:hypothetical protein
MLDLAFAEGLVTSLRLRGEAKLMYISAEMQPFSNQQKPDIVYVPYAGSFGNHTIFVEIKLDDRALSSTRATRIISDRKAFAEYYLEKDIRLYVVVTALPVSDIVKAQLSKQRIKILDKISNQEEVLAALP